MAENNIQRDKYDLNQFQNSIQEYIYNIKGYFYLKDYLKFSFKIWKRNLIQFRKG
jgi:hypothetical protein